MASLTPSILFQDPHSQIFVVAATVVGLVGCIFALTQRRASAVPKDLDNPSPLASFLRFFYASFLKPHAHGVGANGQQDALESFYKAQAGVYDRTRKRLLRGREDMLGLVAAQLVQKAAKDRTHDPKRIWVDIGGGTGWNIEAMSGFVSVPDFFSSVYLVDFSPSLCEVARRRFARLGWTNVKVICQDARSFRLEDHEGADNKGDGEVTTAVARPRSASATYYDQGRPSVGGADLLTLSYSLSMIVSAST
jgi:betaine lipid synthase